VCLGHHPRLTSVRKKVREPETRLMRTDGPGAGRANALANPEQCRTRPTGELHARTPCDLLQQSARKAEALCVVLTRRLGAIRNPENPIKAEGVRRTLLPRNRVNKGKEKGRSPRARGPDPIREAGGPSMWQESQRRCLASCTQPTGKLHSGTAGVFALPDSPYRRGASNRSATSIRMITTRM
jgi:hypothetical protein